MKKNLVQRDSKYWISMSIRYALLDARSKTEDIEQKRKLDKLASFFRFVSFLKRKEYSSMNKTKRKFSSEVEEKAFGLYQHVARKFMKENTEKEYEEPTYSEPSGFSFSPDSKTLSIEYEAMYCRPTITFAFLQDLSEAFKTKHIDLENGVTQEGCQTCDYGSNYGVIVKIRNIGINFNVKNES